MEGHWLWPSPPPVVETRTVRVNGLVIQVPVEGEQCWDTTLPCAPAINPLRAARGASLDGHSSPEVGNRRNSARRLPTGTILLVDAFVSKP